jgi:hypothetical protein
LLFGRLRYQFRCHLYDPIAPQSRCVLPDRPLLIPLEILRGDQLHLVVIRHWVVRLVRLFLRDPRVEGKRVRFSPDGLFPVLARARGGRRDDDFGDVGDILIFA